MNAGAKPVLITRLELVRVEPGKCPLPEESVVRDSRADIELDTIPKQRNSQRAKVN